MHPGVIFGVEHLNVRHQGIWWRRTSAVAASLSNGPQHRWTIVASRPCKCGQKNSCRISFKRVTSVKPRNPQKSQNLRWKWENEPSCWMVRVQNWEVSKYHQFMDFIQNVVQWPSQGIWSLRKNMIYPCNKNHETCSSQLGWIVYINPSWE